MTYASKSLRLRWYLSNLSSTEISHANEKGDLTGLLTDTAAILNVVV